MLHFNDWSKKDKKTREQGYTLTKSGSGLPLFVLDDPLQKDDEPILLDDEPVKKKETIPQIVVDVADFISAHNN
jgi:hypothetical protein